MMALMWMLPQEADAFSLLNLERRAVTKRKATGSGKLLAMWLAWWRAYRDDTMEWPRCGRSRSTVTIHVYGKQ